MASSPSVGARLYAAALWLYPTEFRREFSSEMVQDFEDASTDAARSGSWDRTAWWICVARDLLTTISVQWWRTGLPLVALCALGGALGAAAVAAAVGSLGSWMAVALVTAHHVPAPIVIASIVLTIVTATVVFCLCFARVARRPRRGVQRIRV